jgi:hypothetical protein
MPHQRRNDLKLWRQELVSGTNQLTCESVARQQLYQELNKRKCGRLAAQSVAWPTVAVDQTTGKGCVIRKRRPSCPTEGGRNRLLQSKENKFYATVRHNGHTRMTPPRRLFIQLPACIACSCIPRVSASSISQLGGAHACPLCGTAAYNLFPQPSQRKFSLCSSTALFVL